jgi:hypothetical protein
MVSVRPGADLGFRTSTNGQDLDERIGSGLEIEVQVLKSKSGGLPRVNTRGFFFSPPFSGGLPRVNTTVFLFFFPPFSGGLPRVNTKVLFCFFFSALFR